MRNATRTAAALLALACCGASAGEAGPVVVWDSVDRYQSDEWPIPAEQYHQMSWLAHINDAVAIETADNSTLALLRSDGTCMVNSYYNRSSPSSWSLIRSLGASHWAPLVAVKQDGTVMWIAGSYGVSPGSPVPGLSNIIAAAVADNSQVIGLRSDGTVVSASMSSASYYTQYPVPSGLNAVTAVAAGSAHFLALKSDGTVVAWGNNDRGQCNVPPGLYGVTAIAAGNSHSLALKSDGTVVAWGANDAGQATPPAGLGQVRSVKAGGDVSLAIRQDGSVVSWGRPMPLPANLRAHAVEFGSTGGGYAGYAIVRDANVVHVEPTTPTILEGVSAPSGLFTIRRTGALAEPLTVHFRCTGPAVLGRDYQLSVTDSITMPAHQATATVSVTPLDDSFVEGSEWITLRLQPGPGYVFGLTGAASIMLHDNDSFASGGVPDPYATTPSAGGSSGGSSGSASSGSSGSSGGGSSGATTTTPAPAPASSNSKDGGKCGSGASGALLALLLLGLGLRSHRRASAHR